MTLQEVKDYLEQNKDNEEVKTFLDSYKVQPTLEVFKDKLTNDKDFKAYLDSEKDKHHSKALETWKTNHLQKLVDEEVKKRFPQADPKDTELAKLKQEMENMKKETLRKELTNQALIMADEKKLPKGILEYFIGEDETTTQNNISKLESVWADELKKAIDAGIEERFKDNKYTPPSNNGDNQGSNTGNDFINIIRENQAKRD